MIHTITPKIIFSKVELNDKERVFNIAFECFVKMIF